MTSFVAEMWQHKSLAFSVTVISVYLGDIYTFSRLWVWVWRLDRLWYSHLIHSRWSWMMVNPWAYRLQTYRWTSNIAWFAILFAVSWMTSHLHPRQRGLLLTLLLLPQVLLRVPYLWTGLTDWLHEPGNPIRFYSVLWFSIYTFIVMPFSILLGGAASRRSGIVRL